MKQLNFKFESNSEFKEAKKQLLDSVSPIATGAIEAELHTINQGSRADNILSYILVSLIKDYFPHRLDLLDYRISWSTRRQKRTLASCNLKDRKILVAQELKHPDYQKYLRPLIYHELCHAVLGYSLRSEHGKSRWHGKEFRFLEKQHPEIIILNKWIKDGGWRQAVRRHRARTSTRVRTKQNKSTRSSLISRFLKNLGIK